MSQVGAVDVVDPVRRRIIDYAKNPWQIIQWSAATPAGGLRSEVVVIDTEEVFQQLKGKLKGKTILTSMDARNRIGAFSSEQVAAVITDRGIPGLPDATAWTKFGWGAIPLHSASARIVGLVLSQNDGAKLRALVGRHATLTLHIDVQTRNYVGDHDLVSGIIEGADDPQEELWVLAHSAEPGAIDNASGVAVCLEAARAIEQSIRSGHIKRPKRSIRFLSGYECYSFFNYMEHERRYQTPIAGLCVDTVGARPEVCDGQFSWRATIPMSATFVDRIGETVARAAIRACKPGYTLVSGSFVSTSDTLAGDPKYGFPCPWITTHYRKGGNTWAAYHSSADVPALISPAGMATATLTSAGYLAYLADAGNEEVIDIARSETARSVASLRGLRNKDRADYLRIQHHVSMDRLTRWIWGGSRHEILGQLNACEQEVSAAGPSPQRVKPPRSAKLSRVVRRTRPITPTPENTREPIASRIRSAGLSPWALFWADGKRTIAEITKLISLEHGKAQDPDRVSDFFEAHHDLGYVDLIEKEDTLSKRELIADFRKLGVAPGQVVMMHSSLSSVGHVSGGPNTIIDALLAVLGKRGTLVMPSFNHGSAEVYNKATSRSISGAIPDAFWRRPGVHRSNHPSHAVAAFGPKATEITAGHVEAGIWTAQSPIARLAGLGGFVLSLGVTHTSSTAYHVGELSVPCGCIDPVGGRFQTVEASGLVREIPGLAWRSKPCLVNPEKLNTTLSRNPAQKSGTVGQAQATLVPASLVIATRRRHLKNACPSCTIKPGV